MASLIGNWYSRLSLRTKATGISLLITSGSLIAVATTGIFQIHRQIAAEQRRSADAVALGYARASALPLAVGDSKELSRLANTFLRDGNVLFIAAYGAGRAVPLATAVRDAGAYKGYVAGEFDAERCVIGVSVIEAPGRKDGSWLGPAAKENTVATPAGGVIGRVVVGLSTGQARMALEEQIRATVIVTATSAGVGSIVLFVTLGMWLRRLDRLSAASQTISRGDFEGSIGEGMGKDDEIGRLASAFESMRQALHERDGRLRVFTETLQEQVKQRTSDLEKALGAAEEASRAKSMFLANMSHELRTPLNGVIGMVDLLLKTHPDVQQRRYCDVAKASARSLLELINDILDFSKIEAGKLELDVTDFDLPEAMETITQMLSTRAAEKKLLLTCRCCDHVPRRVSGDPVRFRQVLMNLVSNAVKFTQTGGVSLSAEVLAETETHATVKMSVKDTGIGIPPDRLDRLFKSFSQVDASTTRKFGGTGLGLAISQRIVEMMGGQIGVESTDGQGSTFWFTAVLPKRADLPKPQTSSKPDEADSNHELAGVRVLLAEDNEVNQMVASELLEMAGCKCDIVMNGREAVEAAMKADAYDVILMDCQMPEMDGFEATRHIRAAEETTGQPRRAIVALTANAIKGDRERCLAVGMDGYVTKPIDPPELFRTIRSMIKERRATDISSAPAIRPSSPKVEVIEEKTPVVEAPQSVPVDVPELQRRCLGNRKIAAKALTKFGETLESYVQAISDGIGQGDADSVASAAHKIKGAAGNVSAERVRQVAAELEQLARADSLSQLQPPLDALRQEVDRVKAYLATALESLALPKETTPAQRG